MQFIACAEFHHQIPYAGGADVALDGVDSVLTVIRFGSTECAILGLPSAGSQLQPWLADLSDDQDGKYRFAQRTYLRKYDSGNPAVPSRSVATTNERDDGGSGNAVSAVAVG